MPSNLLTADTLFPHFTEEQSTNEKFTVVTNYLYMLLEQLRYTLSNLGLENINGAEFDSMAKIITDPVYIRIQDDEGNIAALQVTAQGLGSRISDAEGNVSLLQQTSSSLTSRVSSVEGNISTLQQTASSLTSRISDAEGNISTLQQTASGLTSRVSSVEGNISILQQTVNSITLSVSNDTSSSIIKLMVDGVAVASKTITFTGMVTFTDLSTKGATTIYGGNVNTDTLQVNNLYGTYVYLRDSSGTAQGRISITNADTATYAVDLASYGALSLSAWVGDVYIESGAGTYLMLDTEITAGGGDFIPNYNNKYSCGNSSHLWSDVYAYNDTIVTSDLTKKHDISYGLERFDGFFDGLMPMSFVFNENTSGRTHIGLGAQDVEQDLYGHGFTTTDFAGLIKSPKKDENGNVIEGEYDYALRYGEFIALCIDQIQKLKNRVNELEEKLI